jgi:hypothetical protein
MVTLMSSRIGDVGGQLKNVNTSFQHLTDRLDKLSEQTVQKVIGRGTTPRGRTRSLTA